MKTLLQIFLTGFVWITRDIIRVPETFRDSWFNHFAGNIWIDPQVSWTNKYDFNLFVYPFVVLFSDLFHSLGTIYLILWIWILYTYKEQFKFWQLLVLGFIAHGTGVFLGYEIFRVLLK